MPVPLKRPRVATTLALVVAALVAAVVTVATAPLAQAAPAGFVTRCGIHFCLDGRTFYFAGTNTYDVFTYGGSWGDTGDPYMEEARMDAHLAHLQEDKVAVVRVWMFDHEQWHGFESTKGV